MKFISMLLLVFVWVNYAAAQDLEREQSFDLDTKQIVNPYYDYVASKRINKFPAPVVTFTGDFTASDKREILNKLIYPAINKTGLPVAAIIVSTKENSDYIAIDVIRYGGYYTGTLVERNTNGHFNTDDYVLLLEEASIYDGIKKPKPRKIKQKRKNRK